MPKDNEHRPKLSDPVNLTSLQNLLKVARGGASESSQQSNPLSHINHENPDDAHKRVVTDDLRTDITLKKRFAERFTWILVGQLALMNFIFILLGFGVLKFQDTTINIFMVGTLTEVFAIVLVMTRYLFSRH